MDELIQKLVGKGLSKDEVEQLFANPAYKREDIVNGIFNAVVKAEGHISSDAKQVFIGLYAEFGNEKTSTLSQQTIANAFNIKGAFGDLNFLEKTARDFCINDGKSHSLTEFNMQCKSNYINRVPINLHYSEEFAIKRKQAVDDLFVYMDNMPEQVLQKIAPDIKPEPVLTDYLQHNWDKLSDDQLCKIGEVLSEKLMANLGHEKDLKVRPFTKYQMKGESAPEGTIRGSDEIDMNMPMVREDIEPPLDKRELNSDDKLKFKIADFISVTLHEDIHLIQADLKSFTDNKEDLAIHNIFTSEYSSSFIERDAHMIKSYINEKLMKKLQPQDEYIKNRWQGRDLQGVFYSFPSSPDDLKIYKLTLDNDFKKIATSIFGLKPDLPADGYIIDQNDIILDSMPLKKPTLQKN